MRMGSGGIEITRTMPDRILSTATRLRDVATACFEGNKACGRQPLLLPANKHHAPRKTRAVLSDVKQKSGRGETTGQVKRCHSAITPFSDATMLFFMLQRRLLLWSVALCSLSCSYLLHRHDEVMSISQQAVAQALMTCQLMTTKPLIWNVTHSHATSRDTFRHPP